MSQKVVNRTTGLVDYKELETNILSSIREGRPLTGRDGALTPFIKKLLEVSLEGEIENHLSAIEEMGGMQRLYVQAQGHLSY
ncbi:mutator family transposase [Trichonephila clavata]|uniref:Mutator family transposase n=1 Tax=Trichonephila clavata TaxID=2740835 RepID=A0A8X6EY89_TRICU|nr:mutator family transposase [Trichonephila clavata]